MDKTMREGHSARCWVLGAWCAMAVKGLTALPVLALLVGLGALPASAAISRTTVKTVAWTLPSDWEAQYANSLDQICEPVGAPSMPYYNALIEVPSTATNFAITASGVAYRTTEKDRPTPVLEPSVVGEPANAPVEDAALYAGIYPSDVFEQGEKWEMNGKTYLPVRIKVYRWNGPAAKVEALASISLSIACTSPRTGLKLTTSAVPSTKVDYIVISPHNFVEYWKPFVEYRQTTHTNLTFQIVDANDIYSTYSGHDDALKIHHFIEAMYKLGTKYILLGAGAQHTGYDSSSMIMTRIVYTKDRSQSCDYYYCVVDKIGQEVWDYDGDGVYLASKNSSGGYASDAAWKVSWEGKMMVHRFPARTSVSLGGKTRSAKEQIEGYVNKLKRYEQGLFAGRFSQAVIANTLSENYNRYHGNTSADCTQERQFYDLGANIFSEEHGSSISLNEYETRERAPSYYTLYRPVGYNRSVLQLYYSNGETASTFYGRDFDSMIINSHGSPETVEPLNRNGVFGATGLCGFHFLIVPCHAGNPCSGGNTEVSISEAGVVNPEGGSLVSFGNSNTGLWGGKDTFSEKVERDVIKMLYRCQNGAYNDAGTSRLWAMNNYKWTGLSPNSQAGIIMCDTMAYGDPLVKLTDIYSRTVSSDGVWHRADQPDTPSDQEFASGLTVNAGSEDMTVTITNAIGAATLDISGTSGKTLTLNAEGNGKFKVSNKVTVGNGMTLNWDVPGGFGRNGIQFSNGGNLRLRAEGYYGIEFQGIGTMAVAPPSGATAIVDFDSKNYFRDGSGKFTALNVEGPGETIFRSRQAGIFNTTFTIPVTGGTLTLETPCVGGSGQQTSTTPLFAVTNATLAVRPNPHWSAECFSRRVIFENGTLASRYDKFYLGPNVSGYPGLDISVGGTNSVFTGTSPIRLNGQLRIHTVTGGVLNVTGELVNGNGTGSIAIDNGVTLKLAGVNTFSGGVTVPNGARLVVDNVRGLGTGNIVVQSGGVLQLNAMPMAGVSSVTLQSGAKLVLKSSGSGGSYQMYSPSTTAFSMADDVKVYDSSDETKELDGIVTPEGAYFISDAAKYWANIANTTWTTDSSILAWKKKDVAEPMAYTNGDTVLFKNVTGENKVTVAVSGDVAPGMMAFQNTETPYEFTGSGTITVGSMATAGTTSFDPSIKATSQVSVGGKTTLGNVTTPTLNVAGGGKLNMTGTVSGIDTVRVIQFKITDTVGPHNTTPREHAPEMSDLRFYDKNNTQLYFPIGTTVKDNCGSTCTISGKNTSTGAHTFSATSGSVYKLFDQDCSTYHMIGSNIKGPWTITITMPSDTPMEMFAKFKYGRAQNRTSSGTWGFLGAYPDANPRSWVMYAGESESTLKQFTSKSGWVDATASSLTDYMTGSWTSSSKATVQNGGAIYLNGTYNVPVTINSGATLAITNTSMVTFGSTKTWPSGTYAMTVDAAQAKKTNGWFQVTKNAGLSSLWSFQTDDETAVDVKSGELWVATAGVMAPPYSRTISGENATANWNTTDWLGKNSEKFTAAWGSSITKPTGTATLNVTGTNLTMSVDCTVALDTLTITTPTNCFPQTLTVTTGNSGAANISAIDLRTFNGYVDWQPTLASWGCNVYAGTNSVKITKMTSGKGALQVGEGGRATVPEKFASYDVDPSAYVRFTGTHNFAMSDIPTKGYLSFANTTLSGAFQSSLITYIVENGDALTFTGDSNNYNGRMSSSFDIRGGTVTINSNGASTWFGINGDTTYNQTGGVFKCTANDTSMSANNSGFLVGYSASKTEDFEFNITGGRFELPNTYINFYGPVRFNLSSNGVVQAKGVYRGSNKGTITVNPDAVFELGSIGLIDGACDFNLYGGTLAGFENNARTRSSFNLVGLGTLAAKSNTTFTIDGGINADSATLNFGKTGYEGTVKLETIPEGVTNITVTAGTWDMGECRPTNDVPVSVLNGTIAARLTADELRQAAGTGFKLIKTSLTDSAAVLNHVAVTSDSGAAISAHGSVKDGYLYITIEWVYPLKAVTVEDTTWEKLDWYDSIGLKFADSWNKVASAVLSNTLDNIVLAIPAAYTGTVTTVNAGTLSLTNNVTLPMVDDSASTGKTTIGFTANNVTAGAETVIKYAGNGTLTLANGKCAALWNNLTWGGTISGFSGTAKIKYVGDTTLTSAPYNSSGDGYVSYAQKMAVENLAFANALTRLFEDGLDASFGRFVMGNNQASGQTFYQTGGKILVTGTGDILDSSPTDKAPLLFSHWNNPVTYYLTGGSLIATNGINGSVYFGRDGVPKLYIGGGETKATLRTNGLINDSRDAKDKAGSVLELLPNGYLEMGNKNFVLYRNAELKMSGGTYLAYDDSTLTGASKFTLTDGTTSTFAAAPGKTLTISAVPTGTGTIVCGDSANTGSVILKGGDYSAVKLDGTFTIYLTSAQDSATVNTALFTPASEDMDLTKVTVLTSAGAEIAGKVCLYNGKATFVPETGYAMPVKATINCDTDLWNMVWHDSSSPARVVDVKSIANCSEAWLEVASNATFTVNTAKTLPSLRIYGDYALSFVGGYKLTLTSATIETDVSSTSNAVIFTSANIAEGKTLEVKYAGDVSAVTGTGKLKLTSDGRNYADLDFSKLGNSNSTIELSGAIGEASGSTYLINTDCSIGTLDLSGALTLNNGYSANTYSFGKLIGSGSLAHTTTQTFKFSFADASAFTGSLSTKGAQIGIGASPTYASGTIAISGEATIASNKSWCASNGVKVQTGGELSGVYPRQDASVAPVQGTLTVEAGGYLNLVYGGQGADRPTEYVVSTGTLTINGGLKLNGEVVRKDAYTISNGTITLNSATVTGASVCINVIGGNKNLTGKSITSSNTAGIIPVKGANWNQAATKTDGTAVSETKENLVEVLSDGSLLTGPMKATFKAACAYVANNSTPSGGDAEMMYGYLDDGETSNGFGATITVENIPYSSYDVYVYMGTDQTTTSASFAPVTVADGNTTVQYPSTSAGWGVATSARGTVTLCETNNYLKFTGLTGSTLSVKGAKKGTVASARCGIAGIQIFNTGTRVNELTWNGEETGGTWNKTSESWSTSWSESTTWSEVAESLNIAKFNSDTVLTLGETVYPDVLDILAGGESTTYSGFIPTTSVTVAEGKKLKDVLSFAAAMSGSSINSKGAASTPYVMSQSDSEVVVQFKLYDGDSTMFVKCVKVTFTQSGNDIVAVANYAKYKQTSDMSTDFDNDGTGSTVATADNVAAYGVKNVTLTFKANGVLTVSNASNFGKAFIVTNGTLCVAAGDLAQDVTLAPGAKINLVSATITNEYVVTKGKVTTQGDEWYDHILFNGAAIENTNWTLDLDSGTLIHIEKPGEPPFTYTISAGGLPGGQPLPTLAWTNLDWLASNWFYVKPEEWVTNTVSEAQLTVESGVTNTLVANANISIDKMTVLNSGVLTITNGLPVGGDVLGVPFALNVTTLDDSSSSGTTILGFAPTNVTAGVDTRLTTAGVSTLAVGDGQKATFCCAGLISPSKVTLTDSWRLGFADVTFTGSDTVQFFQKNGTLDFDGPVTIADDATYSQDTTKIGAGCLALGTRGQTKSDTLTLNINDDVTAQRLVTGNGKRTDIINQNGGTVTLTRSSTGNGESDGAMLLGWWDSYATYNLNAGTILAENGSVILSFDGQATLNVGAADETQSATLRALKVVEGSKGAKSGAVTVYPNGTIEIKEALTLGSSKTFALAGGVLRSLSNATVTLSHSSGLQVTAPSSVAAANETTLTIASAITGTGDLTIGAPDWTGTVKFTGDLAGFTGAVTLTNGTLEVAAGALTGDLTLGPDAKLNLTGTDGESEYEITAGALVLGEGASITNNITVNGKPFNTSDKWTLEGGSLKRVKPTTPFSFTITQSKAYSWKDLAWKGANGVPVWAEDWSGSNISAELTVTKAVTAIMSEADVTLTSLVLNGPGAIKFTASPSCSLGTVTGDGVIIFEGCWPITSFATLTSDAWTGTLKICNVTDCKGASKGVATFAGLGSANSTVEMDNIAGWFDGSASCKTSPWKGATYGYALKVIGKGLTVNDGSSDTGYCFRELLGDGPITVGKSTGGPAMRFTLLDASNFTGAITNFGNAGITLGTPSRNPVNGEMVVAAGDELTLPTGQVWSSPTMTIDGTLCGEGTLVASTLNINGAVNTTNGVPNYSGTVTFGDTLTVTIPEDATFSYCFLNGKNASPETTASITNLVVVQDGVATTNKHVVLKSSNGCWLKEVNYKVPFSLIITDASGNWSAQPWKDAEGTDVAPTFWTYAPAIPVEISVVGSNTITLDSAVKVTSMTLATSGTGTLTFAGDKTLTVQDAATIPAGVTLNKDKVSLPKVTGAGTLQTSNLANATTLTEWTGTYEVTGNSDKSSDWDMTSYYNGTASTFKYSGTCSKGYFHQAALVNYGALNLTGSITFDNGYSTCNSAVCTYIYTSLSGSGSWVTKKPSSNVTPIIWFKDVKDFTGSLSTLANNYRFVLGDGTITSSASYPIPGGLTVIGDVTLAAEATITAPSGVLVTNATLTVASSNNLGTVEIQVGGDAKLVAPSGTLTNAITVDAGGTLDITVQDFATADSVVITTGSYKNNGTLTINGAAVPAGWRLENGTLYRRRGTVIWLY